MWSLLQKQTKEKKTLVSWNIVHSAVASTSFTTSSDQNLSLIPLYTTASMKNETISMTFHICYI